MSRTLVHRGPDDDGVYVDGATALAHRRLSIVDLDRGQQPMRLPGTPLTIVYNGEVYNHMKLRDRLETPAGFRTTCDTETILAAFRQTGPACLESLRGMFAFAVHNQDAKSLFIARDRIGIKPLYYYKTDRLFAFASEIKALLAHPDIHAEVNTSQLPLQLTLKYTLDDQTLFRGIRKLLPGHYMQLREGNLEIQQYWDLSYTPKTRYGSYEDACDEFRERFNDAVRCRLMADVPLGVFLSGGIDSSVIAASMSNMVEEPIRAFSIGFAEREYSELKYSRQVARHVGANVREITLRPDQWFSAWPKMVYHEDEPLAHPSSVSLHFVSMLAAEDVKVVLTGEGSDELLAGYERYYESLANLRYGRYVPGPVRGMAKRLIDLLPDRSTPKRKAVRTSLYLPNTIDSVFLDNYAAFARSDLQVALRPRFQEASVAETYQQFARLMDASDADELLDKILYADMKTYLLELLMKQDQMSMSASLESRVPFLDHHLVEFVCQLPNEYKLRGFQTKRILRSALGDTIPKEIVTRKKKGFPTPTRFWFRGEYAETMRQLLQSDQTLLVEYVQPDYIEHVLSRHVSGEWNLEEQIWTLGNLEIWLRTVIDGQDPETVLPCGDEAVPCVSFG